MQPDGSLWADRAFLRENQYRTDVNLAARQSLYAYQQPPVDLIGRVLDLVAPAAAGVIADVGCGNGRYLVELARRGHTGPVVGVDMSPGMLHSVRQQAQEAARPGPALLNADATALPLGDAVTDVTMAMHMLYHVPEPELAIEELRRVTRPGGRVVVALNGVDHLRELRAVVTAGLADIGCGPMPSIHERVSLDQGEMLLRRVFGTVTRHDFASTLLLPDPDPVAAYVRSMSEAIYLADQEIVIPAVIARLPGTPFEVTTHAGCLICLR